MAVLLRDIYSALKSAGFSVGIFADLDNAVERPHFITQADKTPDRDALNICTLSELTELAPEARRGCCFLCGDTTAGTVAQLFGAQVLTLGEGGALTDAVNVISRVFADAVRVSQVTSRIFNTLSDDSALKNILHTAGQALGFQMVLGDMSHTVLTHNVPDIPPEEKDWDLFVGRGIAPAFNSVSGCRTYDRIELPCGSTLVLCHNAKLGLYNAMCDISTGGRSAACLAVLTNREYLNESELRILSAMCQALILELERHARPDVVRTLSYEGFLINLLESRISNPDHISVLASKLSLPTDGFFAVFAIDFSSAHDGATIVPMRELLDNIEAALGESRAVNHNGKIVALVDFRDREGFAAKDYTRLLELVDSYGLYCGMSRPFRRLRDAHSHYIEALDCTAIARYTAFIPRSHISDGINYYERCEPFVFIHEAAERGVDLHKFVHPFAIALNEYDLEHDTDYLHTLYEYIRIPKKPQAAEALFIHRNTLDYRLKKIQELVEFSWDDGETLARLFWSISIIFYIRARHDYNESIGAPHEF